MGREGQFGSVNLISALRGVTLPTLAMPGRISLAAGGRGRLKAVCIVIGAGAASFLLALRLSSTSTSLMKFHLAAGLSSGLSVAENDSTIRNEDLTIPGLLNVGNNCFLNVVLQALASSKAVVTFLTTCAEVSSQHSPNFTSHGSAAPVRMPLAVSVSSLMKELSVLGEASRTSSPREVMHALRSYAGHFDLASQQDAAEALLYLASALQEERDNYVQWLKPTLQTLANISLMVEEGDFFKAGKGRLKNSAFGDQLLESWRGQLHWPLEGTLASSLTCQRCAHQYTTQIQLFNDISLSPSQDTDGNIRRGCTLESCLEQFTWPEWIDDVKCSSCSHEAAAFSIHSIFRDSRSMTSKGYDSEGYTHALQTNLKIIEECGCDEACACASLTRQQGGIWRDVHASASKQLKIGRSPEVLCFQLQRMAISADGNLRKVTGHVAFPKVLDLYPFTIAAESCDQTRKSITGETKDKIPGKAERQGTALLNFPFGRSHSMFGNEIVINGDGSLVHKKSSGSDESSCVSARVYREKCLPDRDDSAECTVQFNADLRKLAKNNDPLSRSKAPLAQQSGPLEGFFDEYTSNSPFLSSTNGSALMSPPLTSSISLPYVPRTFPGLQPWSLAILQEEQFLPSPDSLRLLELAPGDGLSHITSRPCIKRLKYSRKLLYGLVSVIVHQGGSQSGHYIVYRKVTQQNTGSESKPGPASDDSGTSSNGEVWGEESGSAHEVEGQPDVSAHSARFDQVEGNSSRPRGLGASNRGGSLDNNEDEESNEFHGKNEDRVTCDNEMLSEGTVEHELRGSTSGSGGFGLEKNLVSLWFRVSDTHVQRVPEQEVFSAHASLLFYDRI